MNILDTKNVYIIAELSANHAGSKEVALETVKKAKEVGANAIKLQTFKPETMSLNIDNELFMANPKGPWRGTKLFDLFKKAMLPWEWHKDIFELARKLNIDCFSSPFDFSAVDFLEQFNPPAYKIASFEITDIPLIEKCAKTGKPIVISTGAATQEDIDLAVETCKKSGNNKIALLKCTSAYPTPYNEVNLKQITSLKQRYNVTVGLSDHTLGTEIPIASVVMGAKIIEKHFILSKELNSPDKDFSLTPAEFKKMVDAIRNVETAMGSGSFTPTPKMISSMKMRRSLFAIKNIKKGEIFTRENIRSLRPSNGLPPKHLPDIIGKTSTDNIAKGTPITDDLILNFKQDK